MSKFDRYRVKLKGEAEPVDVEILPVDRLGVRIDPTGFDMAVMYEMIHNALRRMDVPVPRDRRGFLECLEEDPDKIDDGDALDPTQTTP